MSSSQPSQVLHLTLTLSSYLAKKHQSAGAILFFFVVLINILNSEEQLKLCYMLA